MKAFARTFWNATVIVAQGLAVWPIVVAYLALWLAYPYDPDQITWKREIPLIMQGSSDWGGSNIYAAYVFGHFFFGTMGCLLLTRIAARGESAKVSTRVLVGFVVAYLWLTYSLFDHLASTAPGDFYERCDFFQAGVLFALAYIMSCIWIAVLGKARWLRLGLKYLLSPLILVLLYLVGQWGISPKAGRELEQTVNDYRPNSRPQAAMLELHRYCIRCLWSGGDLSPIGCVD